jgi:hypothetical protein
MAHAQVCMMPNVGHVPVWDDAAAFSRRLKAFCQSL